MTTSPRRTRAALALATIVAVAATSSAGVDGTASALDVPTPSITGFHDGVYVPIDDLLVGEQGDASVVANGDLAVTWAGSHFEGTVDSDEQLASFGSDVGLRGAMTLELAAATGGDVGGTLELLSVPLSAFEVGPAVVTPYLGVDVRFSGHADAGAQVSVVAPFDASAAFSFDGAAHASSETRPRFRPEIGLPDAANALAFDVTVELELTMTFMVLIEGIFPVGGPMLVASLGAGLDVDPARRGCLVAGRRAHRSEVRLGDARSRRCTGASRRPSVAVPGAPPDHRPRAGVPFRSPRSRRAGHGRSTSSTPTTPERSFPSATSC